jgi:hypothetical protein
MPAVHKVGYPRILRACALHLLDARCYKLARRAQASLVFFLVEIYSVTILFLVDTFLAWDGEEEAHGGKEKV